MFSGRICILAFMSLMASSIVSKGFGFDLNARLVVSLTMPTPRGA